MELVVVNSNEENNAEPRLYIRGVEDSDGDFLVEVSDTADFENREKLVYFNVRDGKLALNLYVNIRTSFKNMINVTEDGEIVAD
jgi:hypothetical protein